MEKIKDHIEAFLKKDTCLIYNEISLQNELGIYFREHGYNVRFERNIKTYIDSSTNSDEFVKKEIDLILYKGSDEMIAEKAAIELKFPRNGQYPEEMFEFIKDIRFLEQVKKIENFSHCFCVTIVDDRLFYDGDHSKSPYCYFRDPQTKIPASQNIAKPTGKNKEKKGLNLNNEYQIKWNKIANSNLVEEAKNYPEYYIIAIH